MKMGLTSSQEAALQTIREGKNVFLTGGGGVGKSYLTRRAISELKDQGQQVMVVAPTGKAALVVGGVTAHRGFAIPVRLTWQAKPCVDESSPVYEADVVIIDEISMVRLDVFQFIWESIKVVNELRASGEAKNKKCNPIQLIVVGDFLQLSPVMIDPKDGSPGDREVLSSYYGFDVTMGFAYKAPGWEEANFTYCNLTEIVRQADTRDIEVINAIRQGDFAMLSTLKENSRKIPFDDSSSVIRLTGFNKTADTINARELGRISGDEHLYYATITGTVTDSDKPTLDVLRLKVGARVVMLVNGPFYINGSTGVITEMDDSGIQIRLDDTSQEIYVTRYKWSVERYVVKETDGKRQIDKETVGTFEQLPLKLGYAMTIHKAQGQTLERVELILGDRKSQIFGAGQLYVAISRVRALQDLYINGDVDAVPILSATEAIEFYRGIDKGG